MKRMMALLTAFLFFLCGTLPCFASGLTYAPTPVNHATLLFTRKLGSGYKNAPTPIAAGDDGIFVAAGKNMFKLDAATGETLAKAPMESVSTYTAVAPLVVKDTVYMPLDDGIVQAFSASDLSTVWCYTDPMGGQSLCPVVYEDGCLYTGFWNGETDEANYVCLPAQGSGEQTAVWTFASAGGFYRTGALLTGDYLIVGSDNGQKADRPDAPSSIYCIHKKTGKLVSRLTTAGDIRAGVSRDPETGDCYTVSKSGDLYRFRVNPSDGKLHSLTSVRLSGSSTVTPIPYRGRLYVGSSNGKKGQFAVLDAAALKTVYTAELPGAPQGDMLAGAAYGEENGKVLIYATYNAPPGGVFLFEDKPGQTEPVAIDFFTPPEGMGQYCFCPVTADADGRLYYKNDSGTVFALEGNREAAGVFDAIREIIQLFRRLIACLRGLLTL